jgi:hypothetical protein
VTFRFDLVRPDRGPLPPAAGSPLAAGKTYPARMLVPSRSMVLGRPDVTRYLPPELLHLRRIPLSTTPLEVSGTEEPR